MLINITAIKIAHCERLGSSRLRTKNPLKTYLFFLIKVFLLSKLLISGTTRLFCIHATLYLMKDMCAVSLDIHSKTECN